MKYWPQRKSFSGPNRWKSNGAQSGLYGGWGIPVHSSFASLSPDGRHPWPRMDESARCRDEWWCSCQCPAACHGCHSSVSAGVGCTGHSRPYGRAQEIHKQDAILVPKNRGHNFPHIQSWLNFRAVGDWGCLYCNDCLFVLGSQWWTHNSPLASTPRKNFARCFAGQNVKLYNGTLLHHCFHTDGVQTQRWTPKNV